MAAIKLDTVLKCVLEYLELPDDRTQERFTFAQFQSVCVNDDITCALRKQRELWSMIIGIGLARDVSTDRRGALPVCILDISKINGFLLAKAYKNQ